MMLLGVFFFSPWVDISKTQITVTDIWKFSLCQVKTYGAEINKTV